MTQKNRTQYLGYAAVVAASLLFGGGYSLGSAIEASGMSKTCNSLWTSLMTICFALLFCVLRKQNPFRKITKLQVLLCVICGMCTWMSNFLFLFAYQYLSVAEATMLHFLHPSFIAIFMTLAFKERFSTAKFGAIVCSIVSIFLITGSVPSGALSGIVAAVATGVCYGVYPVLLEVSPLKEVCGSTIILYMNISCAICATVVSLFNGTFSLPISPQVLGLDVLSAISNFFAYLLSAYAVSSLGATKTSFGAMLEPIASCVIAAALLNQRLEITVLYAGVLILASVFLCSLNDRGQSRHPACGH